MEAVTIRPTAASDRDGIAEVMRQTSIRAIIRNHPELIDKWADEYVNDPPLVARTVVMRGTGAFVGYCNLRQEKGPQLEIGIELLEGFRGRGFGTSALRQLVAEQAGAHGTDWYRAVVVPDNGASIAMLRKLGAAPDGLARSEWLTDDEMAERFRREHPELITDQVRRTAEWFGVQPDALLSARLLFRVPADPDALA